MKGDERDRKLWIWVCALLNEMVTTEEEIREEIFVNQWGEEGFVMLAYVLLASDH